MNYCECCGIELNTKNNIKGLVICDACDTILTLEHENKNLKAKLKDVRKIVYAPVGGSASKINALRIELKESKDEN